MTRRMENALIQADIITHLLPGRVKSDADTYVLLQQMHIREKMMTACDEIGPSTTWRPLEQKFRTIKMVGEQCATGGRRGEEGPVR